MQFTEGPPAYAGGPFPLGNGAMDGISGAINGMLYLLGGVAVVIVGGVVLWFVARQRGQMQGE